MHSAKIAYRIRNNRIVKQLFLYGPVRIAHRLNSIGAPNFALKIVHLPKRIYPQNTSLLTVRLNAHKRLQNVKTCEKLVTQRARYLMRKYVKNKDYENVLSMIAQLENVKQPAELQAGKLIARQLDSDVGRSRILKASTGALAKHPKSIFLLHLKTLCQAMAGDYRDAHDALIKRIRSAWQSGERLSRRQSIMLRDSWRIVDLIAREKMDWLEDGGSYKNLLSNDEVGQNELGACATAGGKSLDESQPDNSVVSVGDAEQSAQAEAGVFEKTIDFKEHALQGRLREDYLQTCEKEFDDAKTLNLQLRAITEMLRTGIRHIPDYSSSYDLARQKLEMLVPRVRELSSHVPVKLKKPMQHVLDISTFVNLAHRLGLAEEKKHCVEHLVELSKTETFGPRLWPAVGELSKHPEDLVIANQIVLRIKHHIPQNNREVNNFFRWVSNSGEYQEADKLRARMPKHLLKKEGMLGYVNILQRQGRLVEAIKLTRDIHGELISNPSTANIFANFRLIKRVGELDFLIKTARIFSSVPQPSEPQGIILIAPRNIDHLRRYPLMVLIEMKRRGWAVVPMVEGLLPNEKTGIDEIDVMNGAVRQVVQLTDRAEARMPQVDDFYSDLPNGVLRWGEIDLSHSLWEDAAINRRRYTIEYGCPELQKYLGGLASWSKAMARVLKYADNLRHESGIPTGSVSLFNCRLPDSIFRFYCEKHGDPEEFFYLHAANGYQNYFTNFSTNISQRFVLRNMTRAKEVRSASFPIPENFERYYAARIDRAADILESFEGVTKVKRSTGSNSERSPEALQLIEKIRRWRRSGGKVACAFGKVVCDSSVPFDGGPAHASMKDWINHAICSVQGSNTLLLIKPHPHEINNQIATFPTEYFHDLLETPLGENAIIMGHNWFDIHDLKDLVDLGLIYNGTTAVELGLLGIPCVLAGHFAPIDYPVGHTVPKDRDEFEALLRFERTINVAPDLKQRSAVWLDYMSNESFTQPYRYHVRPVTNEVVYPPWWVMEDLERFQAEGDSAVFELVGRALGERGEPGDTRTLDIREINPKLFGATTVIAPPNH